MPHCIILSSLHIHIVHAYYCLLIILYVRICMHIMYYYYYIIIIFYYYI